jgi:hypothetical protein
MLSLRSLFSVRQAGLRQSLPCRVTLPRQGRGSERSPRGSNRGVAMARSDTPRVLSPLVWLLAVSWLAARAVGRGFLGGLRAWDTASAVVGRGLADVARTAVRALRPAGLVLRRWLRPLSRGFGWLWRQICLRALLILSRPLGRLGRWALARSVRAGQWLRARAVDLAGWLRPVTHPIGSAARRCTRALRAGSRAISRSAARLSAALGRALAPDGLRTAADDVRDRRERARQDQSKGDIT